MSSSIPSPTSIGTLQHSILKAQLMKQLRQTTSKTWLLHRIGHKFYIREMCTYFPNTILKLTDNTLTRYIIAIWLCISWIGKFHPVTCRNSFKMPIGFGSANLHRIPRFRFYFQTNTPIRMRCQLIHYKLCFPLYRVMTIDTAMITIYKIRLLCINSNSIP